MASAHGHPVTFIEHPVDLRHVRSVGVGMWLAGLAGRPGVSPADSHLETVLRSVPVPGHRSAFAGAIDSWLLFHSISRREQTVNSSVMATTPWQWPAVRRLRVGRRIFDCADDWSSIMPSRSLALKALYRRVGAEADVVVVCRESLGALFGDREVIVVPNGTNAATLRTPVSAAPRLQSMVYVGTYSERFDCELMMAVLERLPGWRLELYGPCRYGRGDAPSPEFDRMLARCGGRAVWHGVVARNELAQKLDAADVLVVPHTRLGGNTGDNMKLYDYAARGRPIVATPYTDGLAERGPPGMQIAATPNTFAAAVVSVAAEPSEMVKERRRWAEANDWKHRWPSWSQALFGASR